MSKKSKTMYHRVGDLLPKQKKSSRKKLIGAGVGSALVAAGAAVVAKNKGGNK